MRENQPQDIVASATPRTTYLGYGRRHIVLEPRSSPRGDKSIGRIVMPEIAEWLKTLGMSEYAERFAENGIDISVLRHLTDQDLKDIGVLLGHRRKLLAAIAELAASFRRDWRTACGSSTHSSRNGRWMTI